MSRCKLHDYWRLIWLGLLCTAAGAILLAGGFLLGRTGILPHFIAGVLAGFTSSLFAYAVFLRKWTLRDIQDSR